MTDLFYRFKPPALPRLIHMRHEWGMTLCGRDGWRSNWSSWENEHSLPSALDKHKVTCSACRRKLTKKKAPNEGDQR